MGACLSEETIVVNYDNQLQNGKSKSNQGPDPEFPDMEEWEGDRYKGIGIKRMKGYKCNLPINKLNELREKFWIKKINEDERWKIIQQVCVYDEERSNLTLGRYNFEVADNCINHIIGANGEHYYVPNYCINDPYFEKELSTEEENQNKEITVYLYDNANDHSLKVKISNHDTGKKIKELFKESAKLGNDYKLRLFFSGAEIKDNEFVYQYNLKDDYKIQVMRIKV